MLYGLNLDIEQNGNMCFISPIDFNKFTLLINYFLGRRILFTCWPL
jgi:hypothetical protein